MLASPEPTAEAILHTLEEMRMPVSVFTVLQSDTEPTLVAYIEVNFLAWRKGLYTLAQAYGQDCVAAYVPLTGEGMLIGPQAAAWGEFNPEYFFLPTGSRLSEI